MELANEIDSLGRRASGPTRGLNAYTTQQPTRPGAARKITSARRPQVHFGRLLRELASSHSMFMDGMQKSFVEPMEVYTRAEHGKLAERKKAWEATDEAYVAVRKRRRGGAGAGGG